MKVHRLQSTGENKFQRPHWRFWQVSLVTLALGCWIQGLSMHPAWAQTISLYGGAANTIVQAAGYKAESGLSPRERLLKAVYLLGDGRVGQARVELEAGLREEPDSFDAALLILQIDRDPLSLLGKKSLSYRLKPDESLFRVADRFLKNKYLFYALARYNGIEKPNDIREGQKIKIPQTTIQEIKSRKSVQASIRSLRQKIQGEKFAINVATLEKDLKIYPKDAHLAQYGAQVYFDYGKLMSGRGDYKKAAQLLRRAQQLGRQNAETEKLLQKTESRLAVQRLSLEVQNQLQQGQFDPAIESLVSARVKYPAKAKIKSLLVKSYIGKSDALLRMGGQEDAAQKFLLKAQKLDKNNAKVAAKLRELKNQLQVNRQELLADKYFADGKRYLLTSANLKAFWAFKKATLRNPNHQEAQREMQELGGKLTKEMHEKATAVFNQEEEDVDQAICLWDQVLKIDPDNRLARAERDRADLADCNVKKMFQEEGLCGRRDCTPWDPAGLLAENASVPEP